MGAMFKKSLLYHLWSNQDVKFKPNQPIKQKVDSRINAHENGNLLTIKYFLEADWSKHKRDRPGIVEGEEVVVLEFMKRKIIEGMKDQPFLWVANNDVKNHHFDQKNSERISNSPHGLNIYQHVNHVVFLSALNPTLPHSKFLEDVGITSDHIRDAGVHQITYQAVMRGSLRDSGSLEQKTVYVTDRKTADYLNEVFPGSKIEKIPGLEEQKFKRGRPRVGSKSMSSRDRKRRSRHAKGLKSLGKNLSDQCHKNTNNLYGNFVTSWGTTFKSVNDTKGVKLPDSDVEQFINELHRSHRQKYESKDSSLLFCPSIFDPDKSESSSRGAENVVHATGIWLDNDGGDLNHKEFQKIFPDIRMVCCNTWSGGDRYRVFIPTARSMSADEYETITMYIMHELKRSGYFGDVEADWKIDAGYVVKNHGFDLSHLHAASLFYMPCQAENLEDSFFDDHPGELLDPTDWLNAAHVTMPDNLESNVVHLSVDNIGQQKVLQAINTYKDIPSGQEKRNHGFYQLGIKLLKMGLDYSSIERYLTEADYDGSRKKKASVKGVINSLQKMKMKFSEAA